MVKQSKEKDLETVDNQAVSSLTTLRALLLADEPERLKQLENKVYDSEQQLHQLAKLLPKGIQQSHLKNKSDLLHYLAPAVKDILKQWIIDNPKEISDVLFPVIGEAIRKAIKKALKNMQANIELALEHSLSPQALKWRLQAWKTGKSFSELLLLNSLDYQIEQVFLIQSETGLLVAHAQSEKAIIKDPEMISGMLTAIKDFIIDSFSAKENTLSALSLGDLSVRLYVSPHATLAAVIRGNPPAEIDELIQENIEQIHRYYAPLLRFYNGDGQLNQVTPYLKNCLVSQLKKEYSKVEKHKAPFFIWLIPIVFSLTMGILFYQKHQTQKQWQTLLQSVENEAGWVLKSVDKKALKITVFKDPLAKNMVDFKHQLNNDLALKLKWHQIPFLSLDNEILIKRIKTLISIPQTVQFKIKNNILYLSGKASKKWFSQQNFKSLNYMGINRVNINKLQLINTHNKNQLNQIIKLLKPPKTVKINMNNHILYLSGYATEAWFNKIKKLKINGVYAIDYRNLINLNYEYNKKKQ